MEFPVGKQCKQVLKMSFTLLFLIKHVFSGLQMLVTFTEVRRLGDFVACSPWTLVGMISHA